MGHVRGTQPRTTQTHAPASHVWPAGKDVTLVSFSKMVGFCLKAAETLAAEGIDCEVRTV